MFLFLIGSSNGSTFSFNCSLGTIGQEFLDMCGKLGATLRLGAMLQVGATLRLGAMLQVGATLRVGSKCLSLCLSYRWSGCLSRCL